MSSSMMARGASHGELFFTDELRGFTRRVPKIFKRWESKFAGWLLILVLFLFSIPASALVPLAVVTVGWQQGNTWYTASGSSLADACANAVAPFNASFNASQPPPVNSWYIFSFEGLQSPNGGAPLCVLTQRGSPTNINGQQIFGGAILYDVPSLGKCPANSSFSIRYVNRASVEAIQCRQAFLDECPSAWYRGIVESLSNAACRPFRR